MASDSRKPDFSETLLDKGRNATRSPYGDRVERATEFVQAERLYYEVMAVAGAPVDCRSLPWVH
jgi:hypothetical protein